MVSITESLNNPILLETPSCHKEASTSPLKRSKADPSEKKSPQKQARKGSQCETDMPRTFAGLKGGASPSNRVLISMKSPKEPRYYENQISNLKSELQVFEQEERKIIDLLVSNNQARSTERSPLRSDR